MKSSRPKSLLLIVALLTTQQTLAQSGGGFGGRASSGSSSSGGSSGSRSSSSGGDYGSSSTTAPRSSRSSDSSFSSVEDDRISYSSWNIRSWAADAANDYFNSNPVELQRYVKQIQEIEALSSALSNKKDFILNPQNGEFKQGGFNFNSKIQYFAEEYRAEAKNNLIKHVTRLATELADKQIETEMTQNFGTNFVSTPQIPQALAPRLDQRINIPGPEAFSSILSTLGVPVENLMKVIETPQKLKATAYSVILENLWEGFRKSQYNTNYNKVTSIKARTPSSNSNTFKTEFISTIEKLFNTHSITIDRAHYTVARDKAITALNQFAIQKAQALGRKQAAQYVEAQLFRSIWEQKYQSEHKTILNKLKSTARIGSDFKGEIISNTKYFLPESILSLRVDQITNFGGGIDPQAMIYVSPIRPWDGYIIISKPQSRSTQPFIAENIGKLELKDFALRDHKGKLVLAPDGSILLPTDKQIQIKYSILNLARSQTIQFKMEDALSALVREKGQYTNLEHSPVFYITELLRQEFALKHKDFNAYNRGNVAETPAYQRTIKFISSQKPDDQKLLKGIFRAQVSRIQGRKLTAMDMASINVQKNFKAIKIAFE